MKFKENDTVVTVNGMNRRVLGICGEVYHVSQEHNLDVFGDSFTESDLASRGFLLNKKIKNKA